MLDVIRGFASGSKVVAEAVFAMGSTGTPSAGVPYIQAFAAIRIERTTCGLRIAMYPAPLQ